MKKSLFISILALLFSVAALVKVFYPCKKAAEAEAPAAVAAVNVEEILNEKPEIIFNAMQKYQTRPDMHLYITELEEKYIKLLHKTTA